jgi:hypothetical protein
MDETDDAPQREATADRDGDADGTAPASGQHPGGRPPADDPDAEAEPASGTTDREAVAAAVQDVEGIEYEEGGGNVAGPSPGTDLGPVTPGAPTLEGAVFVLLGVALTVVVIAQLVGF